ncbi:MAG: Ig-like domain-containing protein [Candidatus Hermodarchaeia archaeon]|jgi:hypothetical protein
MFTFHISSNTTLFNIDRETGEIALTPTNDDVGVYIINISVIDENEGFAYQIVTFTVENVNDPPTLEPVDSPGSDETIKIEEGVFFFLEINATDVDLYDTLTFSDNTDLFDIDSETGEIMFTPRKGDRGLHTVEITVTDSEGEEDYMVLKFEVVGEDEEGLPLLWLLLIAVFLIVGIIIFLIVFKRKEGEPGGQAGMQQGQEPVEEVFFQEEAEPPIISEEDSKQK